MELLVFPPLETPFYRKRKNPKTRRPRGGWLFHTPCRTRHPPSLLSFTQFPQSFPQPMDFSTAPPKTEIRPKNPPCSFPLSERAETNSAHLPKCTAGGCCAFPSCKSSGRKWDILSVQGSVHGVCRFGGLLLDTVLLILLGLFNPKQVERQGKM